MFGCELLGCCEGGSCLVSQRGMNLRRLKAEESRVEGFGFRSQSWAHGSGIGVSGLGRVEGLERIAVKGWTSIRV